jgi:hypothetical protein
MFKKFALSFAASVLLTFTGPTLQDSLAQQPGGIILETMNAAGYTYILVDSGKSKNWVAIPETPVKVGDQVSYGEGMVMENFHSKSLDRTFSSIVFSPGLSGGETAEATPTATETAAPKAEDSFAAAVAREQQAQPTTPAKAAETSGGSTGAIVPFAEVKVEKAPGDNSYTVEELFAKAEALNGQKVQLRAKVVKFSASIMGRNWVHLQDGSGNPMNNTHDLVVTTQQTVAKDEIVIVEGMLAANKDFGAGYSYTAIVEDAQIIK